jgi:hypothetical protein
MSIILKTLIKNKLNSGRALRFTRPPVFVEANGEVVVDGAYPTGCPTRGQAIAMENEIKAGKIEVSIITNLGILSVEEHNKGISPSVLKKQEAAKKKEKKKAQEDYKKLPKPKVVSGGNPEGMIKTPDPVEDGADATPVSVVGDESNAFASGSIEDNSPKARALTSDHEATAGPKETVTMFGEDAVVTPVSADGPDKDIGAPIPVDPKNSKAAGVVMPEPEAEKKPASTKKAPAKKAPAKKPAAKKAPAKKAAPLKKTAEKKAAPRKRGAAPKKEESAK